MPKFHVRVEWTQELVLKTEVEADSLEAAKEIAISIDPNALELVDFARDVEFGDVVSDVDAMVDGNMVGCNNMPFVDGDDEEVDDDE